MNCNFLYILMVLKGYFESESKSHNVGFFQSVGSP